MINMKTNLTIKKKILLCCCLFMMVFVGKGFAQLGANDYTVTIKNGHQNGTNEFLFDVFIQWNNAVNTNKFNFFQGGLELDYAAVSNGGVISAQFVPGSADPAVPGA